MWLDRILKNSVPLLLALLLASSALASEVDYITNSLGNGFFNYALTLVNSGGAEPLSGLLVVNGNSVFGLDPSATIGAPAGWSFFPPLPPAFDRLSYFSTSSSFDVPTSGPGSSLPGFSFQSTLDPSNLGSSGFAVIGIGATSGDEIALPNARLVPEPSALPAIVLVLAALAFLRLASRISRRVDKPQQIHDR